ncbi:LPXTG cell wall anchor domain-containing protein [Yinghuangia soli]|uniref:LPXTG cell wall anchor domain-containing protein n=1 Tax=Yinghuangia soli TaxID=2908204 RepID=A0AA41U4M2_9ACTN|nr:LPXTG cell wall anchor domain-containing protein [Yinghuangia soli]MCF2533086.1 LPXTG cell wall anchor domain-containing protein [Yinghuangia soli]
MTSPRTRTVLGLAAATTAAAALTLGLAGTASAAGSLSVSKTTGVKSGDTLTVTGAGFEGDKNVMVMFCDLGAKGASGCDSATIANATPKGGAFTTSIKVNATFGSTDCTKVSCGVVAYDMQTHTLTGQTKITFAAAGGEKPSEKPATKPAATEKPATKPATSKPAATAPAKPAPATTAPATPELAKTGSSDNTPMLVAGGAALVLVGTGAVVATRRRKQTTAV